MGQTRDGVEGHGLFIGSVFGVFTVIFVIFVASMFCSSSKIDPETTYQVFDVTDGAGKTYRNLKRFDGNTFVDHHRNLYSFHGNYTVISRNISGEEFMREVEVRRLRGTPRQGQERVQDDIDTREKYGRNARNQSPWTGKQNLEVFLGARVEAGSPRLQPWVVHTRDIR